MTKTIAQNYGAATYTLALNGTHAVRPMRNCPLMKLNKAESYAKDMQTAGFDVVVINMATV